MLNSLLRGASIAILPGQYFDAETGLHQNWWRDYDPSTGRYPQSDPIGLAGGLSTYGYAMQNPLRWTDPMGLEVYVCTRPIDIEWVPRSLLPYLKHTWVKTDAVEAGMGGECPIPGQNCADIPYSATKTKDHSGQSEQPGASCGLQRNVDEDCVNQIIMPGQPTGSWNAWNACGTFANHAISQCRYGPQIGPLRPNTLRSRGPLGGAYSPVP